MRSNASHSDVTAQVQAFALDKLNADLVGIANIERFSGAPLMMSPQGIMPTARSVVVMALHHPDAAIELGGEEHPQIIGPYNVQYIMNMRLDEISYKMARYIESLGYQAVPIVSSNIWRYKGYKELEEHFAPDMSHLHSAVAAGLSEFGYSGLSITPEYGARQRYVSIITDAVLEPSPLIEPGSVCDNCMICRKVCPSGALSKELDGWNKVVIEDKTYRYVRKNLWRCAWGEHFDLDLDLEIPDKVDEALILEKVKQHGRRAGEMGCCLKACVPKARRYFDRSYCSSPRRRRDAVPEVQQSPAVLLQQLEKRMDMHPGCSILTLSVDTLKQAGVRIENNKQYLPGAKSAVIVCLKADKHLVGSTNVQDKELSLQITRISGGLHYTAEKMTMQAGYDVARDLERAGFSSIGGTNLDESEVVQAIKGVADYEELFTYTVLTEAVLPESALELVQTTTKAPVVDTDPEGFTKTLQDTAMELGADLCGVTSVERLQEITRQIEPFFNGEKVLDAHDVSGLFKQYEPVVMERKRVIHDPADLLESAKSVFVFGVALPEATVDNAVRTPAEAIGPYAYAIYENLNELRRIAMRLSLWLAEHGVKAYCSSDLLGTGSMTATPRGEIPDIFANRFEAWSAGLGRLARAGYIVNPKYGTRLRFMAIVIDRTLQESSIMVDHATELCTFCNDRCVNACSTKAFSKDGIITINGVSDTFKIVESVRCDWAKRYSLIADEGCGYVGWTLDLTPPQEITATALADGLRQQPPIPKYRPCNAEMCSLACPYTRQQDVSS